MKRVCLAVVWVGLVAQCLERDAAYAAHLETVVVEGQTVPGGNGSYSTFAAIDLARDGTIGWVSTMAGTSGSFDNTAILLEKCRRLLISARETDSPKATSGANDPNGFLGDLKFNDYLLGENGHQLFAAPIVNSIGTSLDDSGFYRHDGNLLRKIARENEIVPDGDGRFDHFNDNSIADMKAAVGPGGSVLFWQDLRNLSNGRFYKQAVHRWDDGNLQLVAKEGSSPATHDGMINSLGSVHIDQFGRSLYFAGVNNSSLSERIYRNNQLIVATGQTPSGAGQVIGKMNGLLYSRDGSVALDVELGNASGLDAVVVANGSQTRLIAEENTAPPEGNGLFTHQFSLHSINNRDQVLFSAFTDATTFNSADNEGLYLGSPSSLRKVARENDFVPEGNGRFNFDGVRSPTALLSQAGSVVFSADIRGTSGGITGTDDNSGLYLYENDSLTSIVREASQLLETGEYITEIGDFSIDDAGRVAFFAQTSPDNPNGFNGPWGLYFYSDREIEEVFRVGDTVNGRLVQRINDFQTNDLGQVLVNVTSPGSVESLLLATPESKTPGDFNADGFNDEVDLNIWKEHYGDHCAETHWEGDANFDHRVDGADFFAWQRQANSGPKVIFDSSQAVPEPTTGGLALAALAATLLQQRKLERRR